MNELWFEEALIPAVVAVKNVRTEDSLIPGIEDRIQKAARVNVRVQKPRWREIQLHERRFLSIGQSARYYLIRLGFEFELSAEGKRENVKFTSARCLAYLWSVRREQPPPIVYDIFPKDLREGERRKVSFKVSPKIKLENVSEASLGEISTDLEVGMVEPACIGFTGKDGREPYWELTPKTQSLTGIRHFWLVLEVPQKCTEVRVAVRVEAQAQGFFGVLPLRGKDTVRDHLPSVAIKVD